VHTTRRRSDEHHSEEYLRNWHYVVLGDHLLVGLAEVRAVHPTSSHAALDHLSNQIDRQRNMNQ
jgi:hypothetical protein